jgi:hypothetical protein
MTPPWSDWITDSCFRIRVAPAAAVKLSQLPGETQQRLRQMLQDIAELADVAPLATGRSWSMGGTQLLQLQLGRVTVRYSISEESRTLTIEHVILLDDDQDLSETG